MEKKETSSNYEQSYIDVVPMDSKACGYYRLIYPAQSMFNMAKVNISPTSTFRSLGQDWIYTARICSKGAFEKLIEFKEKSGVKFAIDYDDNLWEELPSYNRVPIEWQSNREAMQEHLHELADLVTCSTEAIAESLLENTRVENTRVENIKVMKNALDYNRWRFEYIRPNTHLNFFYAGSNTHWSQESYGDFSDGMVNYLKDKEVNVLGSVPKFLPSAKRVCSWADINFYPTIFAKFAMANKFIIATLRDNQFNRCKSDLKYLESAAVGRVCLCSDVREYKKVAHRYQLIPWDANKKDIEYIVNRAEKHYDEILRHQYEVLNQRWLNGREYLNLFI